MTLAIVALAVFALIAWNDLRVAFLLFCGLLPTYLIRFSAGGIPTTALEALFVILCAAWFLKREKRLIDIRGWRLLLLLWLIVATVEMFVSPDLRAAAGVWKAYFVEPALFFIMANDFLRAEKDREGALAALAWSAVAIGLVAVVQRFTGWGVPPPFDGHAIPPATDAEFRSTAFYGFPNAIGLFLAPLVPLFVASWKKRRVFIAAALLSVVAIVLAQSEGAIVGILAGLVFLGVMTKKTHVPTIVATVVAAIILLALPMTRPIVISKLTINDDSGRVRRLMWSETMAMLKDHPVFGAGLSGYPIVFDTYHQARYIEIFQYPHDIILNLWTELGLAGIAIFFALVFAFFRASFATKRYALAAAMVALLVHGIVDVPYFKNDLAMEFWLLLALASSLRTEHGTKKSA